MAIRARKQVLWVTLAAVVAIGGYFAWRYLQPPKLPGGFASSNGRIEATDIDIATKAQGRIISIAVDEGDYLTAGQALAQMDTDVLNAQLREAEAELRAAKTSIDSARSVESQRESEKSAAQATHEQRKTELELARIRLKRANIAASTPGAVAEEEIDARQADVDGAKAAVETAAATVAASDAAIATAKTQIIEAEAKVVAAQSRVERIQADLNETVLKAPRDGRVQYRISQPGEVLPPGGKVLNMIDLADVYMTFFLPTNWAGRVGLGAETRLVLDAAPQFVIPAKVTFVADVAQFTPKTVETAEERQKLTFRIKAHIPPDLLKKYIRDVKTGLPGVAYVQLDPKAPWPPNLQIRLPEDTASPPVALEASAPKEQP